MKALSEILYGVSLTATAGDMNVSIDGIASDSRKIQKGFLFVALKGTLSDGHDYIEQVIQAGATVVVSSRMPTKLYPHVAYVIVQDANIALGRIAANFFEHPSKKLKLVGVTGTNGKTTVATLLHQMFISLGYKSGLLSTVVNKIVDKEIPSTYTTPDCITINRLLCDMLAEGCTHCFMEVSSHSVVQQRIAGLFFAGGVFTNITHEHLDYHQTFDNYIKAKKAFFDELSKDSFALVNADDKRAVVMLQNTSAKKMTYGLKSLADFRAKVISNTIEGLELWIDHKNIWFKLIGEFNAYNLIAVYGVATLLGEDSDNVLTKLSALSAVPGRLEIIRPNHKFLALVDYAHTPDALQNVLQTISQFGSGKESIISVVGCGGNRDKAKRPLMAAIACKYSKKVILTSDNPRNEEPMQIISDMRQGLSIQDLKKTIVLTDRKEAIKTACMLANEKDIVLIAGKGHETYQEVNGKKYPFDDRKVLRRMIELYTN